MSTRSRRAKKLRRYARRTQMTDKELLASAHACMQHGWNRIVSSFVAAMLNRQQLSTGDYGTYLNLGNIIGNRKLPLAAELTGTNPDITEGLSTGEYIRRIRHG